MIRNLRRNGITPTFTVRVLSAGSPPATSSWGRSAARIATAQRKHGRRIGATKRAPMTVSISGNLARGRWAGTVARYIISARSSGINYRTAQRIVEAAAASSAAAARGGRLTGHATAKMVEAPCGLLLTGWPLHRKITLNSSMGRTGANSVGLLAIPAFRQSPGRSGVGLRSLSVTDRRMVGTTRLYASRLTSTCTTPTLPLHDEKG